jgi:hypothetical protein
MHSATKIEAAKREYGSLFTSISEALFRVDPARLNFEVNTDEYDSEVAAIIPRLSSAQSAQDVQTILYDELLRSLYTVGVSRDALPSLAVEIWTLWCESERR